MKRMSWTVVLPALLVASGLFLSAHTALADEGEARSRMYEIGTAIEPLTLPAVTGGTPPFTYSLSPALPAGLVFDAATRTLLGTPSMALPATEYIYTVTDASNARLSVPLFSIEVSTAIPKVFALANNYPNPFNPATTIKYALPQAADVELTVYNVTGQAVRTLVAERQNAGRYAVEWDATNDSGHSLSSGMYFYRLEASGEFLETKKMLLLK